VWSSYPLEPRKKAHPIQVLKPCPLVVSRAKRPLRLAISFATTNCV
jgi:hypothetical protein